MASTISAPFFGPRAIKESVHIRRPLRPCIFHPNGHMGIDKAILEYRYLNLWRDYRSFRLPWRLVAQDFAGTRPSSSIQIPSGSLTNAKADRDSRSGSTSARAPFAVSSSNARSTSVTRNARWSSSSPLRYGVWNLEPGGYQLGRSRALQLDPDAAVAHRPPSRDLHAHD